MRFKDLFFSRFSLFSINMIILLSYCYIDFLRPINYLINYVSYFLCFIFFFILIIDRKFTKFSILMILFFISGLGACLLNKDTNTVLYIEIYLKMTGYILYLEKSFKIDTVSTIKILNIVLSILTLINFFTIILYPNGLYTTERYSTNWFFKYDNVHIFMYLPSLVFNFLNSKISTKKNSIISVINFIIITYCVFFSFSSNTIVAYSILIIYMLFKKYINKINILNAKNYFVTYIALFFGFVIFRIQEIFEWFIVGVLKKKITLTGRVHIWDVVMKYIKQKPLIGYGLETNDIITNKYGSVYFTHAHNTILDVLYKGGIIYLISFILIIRCVVKKLYNFRQDCISKYLSLILFCCFIMMNFEARQDKIGLYIILVTSYSISDILLAVNRKDKNNEQC